jgi:hypothetical protein
MFGIGSWQQQQLLLLSYPKLQQQQVKERTKRSVGQKALAKAHENGCEEEEGGGRRRGGGLARRLPPPPLLLLLLLSLAPLPHPMATYSLSFLICQQQQQCC